MAILVDEAIWPWRGERWAHLVSDDSVAELHAFSRRLRVRRLSFSGDHYDVDAAARDRAVDLGAEPVNAREIVRRLRSAGLRRRDVGHWQQLAAVPFGGMLEVLADLVTPEVVREIEMVTPRLDRAEPTSDVRVAARPGEVIAVVGTRLESGPRLTDTMELRSTPDGDHWFTELAADRVS
jgi:hypothetical protein